MNNKDHFFTSTVDGPVKSRPMIFLPQQIWTLPCFYAMGCDEKKRPWTFYEIITVNDKDIFLTVNARKNKK
ncbi:hypothetical protein [Desulfocicer niacini]